MLIWQQRLKMDWKRKPDRRHPVLSQASSRSALFVRR